MSFDDMFHFAVSKLNPSSSPGYPWKTVAVTNALLVKDWSIMQLVRACVERRIKRWEEEEFDFGFVRVFIKREPHKVAKILEGRLRLISSVSVVDQIIGRILWAHMDEWLVSNWRLLPSKLGFADLRGEIVEALDWLQPPDNRDWRIVDDDKSSWDWSRPEEAMWFCHYFRQRVGLMAGTPLVHLHRAAYVASSRAVLTTTGGYWVHFQDLRCGGPQLSGEVKTLSDNTLGQIGLFTEFVRKNSELKEAEILRMLIALGDDTVNLLLPEWCIPYREFLISVGCKPKPSAAFEWPSGLLEVEFCSRRLISREGDYEWISAPRQMWRLMHESVPAVLSGDPVRSLEGWNGIMDKMQYWCAMPDHYSFIRELANWTLEQSGGLVSFGTREGFLRNMRSQDQRVGEQDTRRVPRQVQDGP
jgi:hypothetical protein